MEWSLIWLANLCSSFSAVLVFFSSHVVYCEDSFLAFPLSTWCLFMMVVAEDLLSLLPICFVEDKHVRKSLMGQITVLERS